MNLTNKLSVPRRIGGKRVLTGIDIGAHAIKCVVSCYRNGSWRIIRASRLQNSGMHMADVGKLAEHLSNWLGSHHDRRRGDYIATFPSALVDYETCDPPSNREQTLQFAKETMERLLGNGWKEVSFDFWYSEDEMWPRVQCHLAWTPREYAAEFATRMALAGWRCVAIDTAVTALARTAADGVKWGSQQLVIDISGNEVTFVACCNGIASFHRNRIRISDESPVTSLAAGLEVRRAVAEVLLANWGIGISAVAARRGLEVAVVKHLEQWLDQLNCETTRTLEFLNRRYGKNSIGGIVLCGGGACLRGLAEWLTSQTQVPVRIADIPTGWVWEAGEPYSAIYAQSVALLNYGATR